MPRETFETDGFAFLGRTAAEYERLFDLDPGGWESILDCGAGPSSFAATNPERVVAADPAYAAPVGELRERGEDGIERVATQLPDLEERFVWEFYDDLDDRLGHLRRAHARFLADFAATGGRYVAAALPRLPFPDGTFELALCAHLLFLYDGRLDAAFHRAALAELCRVAGEVRVFPLFSLDGTPSEQVEPAAARLRERGRDVERRSVPFEFQAGADEMLVVS